MSTERRPGGAGIARRVFRRDRLTGQVAIGLVGVLCVAAVVYGVGVASARYNLSNVGAWLIASKKGMVVHANGLAGRVDGKADLIAGMRGHQIKIVQDGRNVLLVDEVTGVVSRIDPSQLKVEQSRPFAVGVQVVIGAGAAYTIDPAKGTVQQINPVDLSAIGQAAALSPPLGLAGIDGKGQLWVPSIQTGQAVPFHAGRQLAPVAVGKPGEALGLSISAGVPVVTNSAAATATIIKPEGTRKVTLPATVSQTRDGVKVPPVVDGQVVPMLGKGGSLFLLNTGTGSLTSVALKMTRHTFGVPQMLGPRVYIPDETAGALIVYHSATNKFERPLRVSGKPGRLDVFVKDGILWANDPDGEEALSVDSNGVDKAIKKYEPAVPGGKRRPLPIQGPAGGGDGNNNDGGGGPGGNSPPPGGNRPTEGPPKPGAPYNVRATPGNGFVTVTFEPPTTGKPERYRIQTTAPGATEQPNGEREIKVTIAAPCDLYNFTVVAVYKNTEVPSRGAAKAKPCVVPGEPHNVQSTGGDGFAVVTFEQPTDGTHPDSYQLEGAPTGATVEPSTIKGDATSLTFRVKVSGSCTELAALKVVAVNQGTRKPVNVPGVLTCLPPGSPGGFAARGKNHGADLSWQGSSGGDVTYGLSWPGGSASTRGTSYGASGLTNNTKHTFTLEARNKAGTTSTTAEASLLYKEATYRNKHNNQTNTLIRPGPSRNGEIGRIPQGQYINITMICQVSGQSVTESESGETSSWWNRIHWNGQVGYLSVTLMEGPRSPSGQTYEC